MNNSQLSYDTSTHSSSVVFGLQCGSFYSDDALLNIKAKVGNIIPQRLKIQIVTPRNEL